MSEPDDLDAQMAQRLFGWEPLQGPDPWYRWIFPGGYAHEVPAYTTDPAATAQVWQWVEQQRGLLDVWFTYEPLGVQGHIVIDDPVAPEMLRRVRGDGATWQEALCCAALALVDARKREA